MHIATELQWRPCANWLRIELWEQVTYLVNYSLVIVNSTCEVEGSEFSPDRVSHFLVLSVHSSDNVSCYTDEDVDNNYHKLCWMQQVDPAASGYHC